jgi:hypothetical protein
MDESSGREWMDMALLLDWGTVSEALRVVLFPPCTVHSERRRNEVPTLGVHALLLASRSQGLHAWIATTNLDVFQIFRPIKSRNFSVLARFTQLGLLPGHACQARNPWQSIGRQRARGLEPRRDTGEPNPQTGTCGRILCDGHLNPQPMEMTAGQRPEGGDLPACASVPVPRQSKQQSEYPPAKRVAPWRDFGLDMKSAVRRAYGA